MNKVRYRVKECYLHFGCDEVFNFPGYVLDHIMIVGKEYFVNTMVTNIISEIILEYTPNDLMLSVWDTSKLRFDKKSAKDLGRVDIAKFTGDDRYDYLATFILDVERWLASRRESYLDEQCDTVYDYERMCYESVPYHIVIINNWEERLEQRSDICEEAFYTSMRRFLDEADKSKTFFIITSSGNHKLPDDIQRRFHYVVHGGDCQNVLSWDNPKLFADLSEPKTVAVQMKSCDYDVLTMLDFNSSIKDILNRKKYPCGVVWDQDRLNELKKLYNMGGVKNDDKGSDQKSLILL